MKEGIVETLIGVIARPTSTIGSICQQRPIGWAIVVYLVVCLVSAFAAIGLVFHLAGLPDFGAPPLTAAVDIPGTLVGTPIIGLLTLVVFTAIYHLVASVLGGKGSYWGLFSGLAFAALPNIFFAPLTAISLPLGIIGGTILYGLGAIGLTLWIVVLGVIAIRENYVVSTGRAVLIYLLPLILLVILGILIAILVMGMIGGLL